MSVILIVAGAAGVLLLGLLLGRYYVPDTRPLRRAAREGAMYIRGLNHVLSRNNDAAIAELTRAVSENTGTVDTYFALGVLFRERGEYERAVRVHQSMLVRDDVSRRMRLEARFQLGLDFESAGFLKRSRRAFEEVLDKDPRHRGAAEKLLSLYEGAGSWQKAMQALRRLVKITGEARPVHESHLFTELAVEAIESGDTDRARKHVKQALKRNPHGVHPRHVKALVMSRMGRLRAAAETWFEVLGAAPDLAVFFYPFLEETYFDLEALDELGARLDELASVHPENVHLRMIEARFVGKRDPALALIIIRRVLEDAPSLLPARRLAGSLVLAGEDPETIRAEYEALLQTLERVEKSYRCARCGYTDRVLFWRCPRCHAWDSVRMAWGRRSGEGEMPERGELPAIPGGPTDRRVLPRQ